MSPGFGTSIHGALVTFYGSDTAEEEVGDISSLLFAGSLPYPLPYQPDKAHLNALDDR